MASSKYSGISSSLYAPADLAAYHIVLRQEEGFDAYETREFDLALDAKFAIGRASKNMSKSHLRPAKNNLFIDSPVVSREHATLTVNTSTGSPHVFITDTNSMHGTYLNNLLLTPNAPMQLLDGDKLQFGVNVNRNESGSSVRPHSNEVTNDSFAGYFVAYKYTFRARLADPEPFSRGFTVPEAESEDEELDITPSGHGSQLNPLVLDDSDYGEEPDYDEGIKYDDEGLKFDEDNNESTMAQLDEEDLMEVFDLSENGDAAGSIAGSVAGSIADSMDDSGLDDICIEGAVDYSPGSPLVLEVPDTEEDEAQIEVSAPQQVQTTSTEEHQLPVSPGLDPLLADCEYPILPSLPLTTPPPPQEVDPDLAYEDISFEADLAPPLPPRPSQKRQRMWDELPQDVPQWYGEGPSLAAPAQKNGAGLDEDLLMQQTESIHASLSAADGIQSPPPTESFDAVPTSSSSACGTGFAIPEVVDAQPPTPTSITSRKRSADEAFDQEVEEAVEEKVANSEAEGVVPTQSSSDIASTRDVIAPTVEVDDANTPPQRPIAQPKSIFRKALRAAKVMVPATALGAVFTVTALTTLPESFFTVA
ncbi:hypothetical protein OPT61_g10509 [Boeremia exigua]|uniref:Uncharacterized protein n=1 Tax=Boeremia exigua TaxID=749465 RepID=A0ACC2HPB6_9PLEO|nr:hypothetical protein OPT61_g10509 [Boeremia exigua]